MPDTVSKVLYPIADKYLSKIKNDFFATNQKQVKSKDFIVQANEWFRSTKLNNLSGWDKFTHMAILRYTSRMG